MLRQLGPMVQQIQQPCNECEGTGEMMNPKDRCKTCQGKKTNSERKVLEVHIDKGMKSGQQIRFNGESDQAPGIIPGDVVISVEEKQHPRFQRKGDDLYCEAEIDLLTALGGGEFAIEHLDERTLHVVIVPGEVIKPSTYCRLLYTAHADSQTPSRSSLAKECHHTDITSSEISTFRSKSTSPLPLTQPSFPFSSKLYPHERACPSYPKRPTLTKSPSKSPTTGKRGVLRRTVMRWTRMRMTEDQVLPVPSVRLTLPCFGNQLTRNRVSVE